MLLSIITVVRNDPEGVVQTLDSTRPLKRDGVEHWVIDGSSDDRVRELLRRRSGEPGLKWISEPDKGLYDAMNKGLERATGDYALFVNAGDSLSDLLDIDLLFAALQRESGVLIGHTVETWEHARWLRPGVGREGDVFVAPPHQATFYPRRFYAGERYRLDIRVAADCDYTERAIDRCGGIYLPTTICEFALGGLSSSYGKLSTLRLRLRESNTARSRLKLGLKIVMWHLLPRRTFYGLLAAGKYTRLSKDRPVTLAAQRVTRLPRAGSSS